MSRRITKPPGGETSDIFTTTPTSTPPSTPRKVKNYMASTIFTPDAVTKEAQHKIRIRPDDGSFNRLFGASDSPQSSPHHQANGHGDNTDGQLTPRGKNHQKSNVLFGEGGKSNGHTNGTNGTNGTTNGTNGHGANGHGNGHDSNGHGANGHDSNGHGTNGHGTNGHGTNGNGGDSGSSSGSATPVGNGHANGHSNGHGNGHTNGHKTNGHSNGSHEGSTNGGTPGKRIPPGGFSSKLW